MTEPDGPGDAGEELDCGQPRGDEPYWADEPGWFEQLRGSGPSPEPRREVEVSLNVRNTGARDFKRVPQGIHPAVCDMVVDCGMQPGGKFGPRHQVYIRWEIPSERVTWTDRHGGIHEGPMSIGKFYTASLAERAALRRDLENWRGRPFTREELHGFDLFRILGTACQLIVTHTSNGDDAYASVGGVMGFPRDAAKPRPQYRLIKYSQEDPDQFDDLPQWLRERVASALTAPAERSAATASDATQEDLPFTRRAG